MKHFTDLKNAEAFVKWLLQNGKASKITKSIDGYIVAADRKVSLKEFCKFALANSHYGLMGTHNTAPVTELFDSKDRQIISGADVVWKDVLTGLTWDAERLFASNQPTEHPEHKFYVMNELKYGGFNDWRLPTVAELQTLSPDVHAFLRFEHDNFTRGKYELWSSDHGNDRDYYYYVDLISSGYSMQSYREEDRNTSSRGDGYESSACTVCVRGVFT